MEVSYHMHRQRHLHNRVCLCIWLYPRRKDPVYEFYKKQIPKKYQVKQAILFCPFYYEDQNRILHSK